MELTPLEIAILRIVHARYASLGFPEPSSFNVVSRDTRGGRWLVLSHPGEVLMPDGCLGMGDYSHIECEGLPDGAFVELSVESGSICALDFYPYENVDYGGGETWWRILNPDTGSGYVVTSGAS